MKKIPFVEQKALRTGAGNLYPDTTYLRQSFTIKTKYGDKVKLYKEYKGGLLVPRNCGIPGEEHYVTGSAINCKSYFKPRSSEQQRLVNESVTLLNNGDSHILEAFTGLGKSILGCEIAGRVGVKTLIIVPKSDIVDQWVKSLGIVFKLKPKDIGLIQGNSCRVAGKDFVIGMVHSVCKENRYPGWVYKWPGLIIVDEVHLLSAETFSQAMWHFPAKLRLGLTATPYRLDGKDFVFYSHIGGVKVRSEEMTLVPKVFVKKSAWQVPIISSIEIDSRGRKLIRKERLKIKPGKTMHIHKMLANSEARNNMIVNFMKQAYDAGRRQIFFSELKDVHLSGIELMLRAKGIPKTDIGWYVGGKSKSELEVVSRKKILLATYKMAQLGTNIPWLDTCILGTPRSDVKQIVGRILREYDNKKDPVVLDIVDSDSNVFLGYFRKRRNWYNSIGANIINF